VQYGLEIIFNPLVKIIMIIWTEGANSYKLSTYHGRTYDNVVFNTAECLLNHLQVDAPEVVCIAAICFVINKTTKQVIVKIRHLQCPDA